MEELSRVREHILFSSVLASTSCVITIIETNVDDEVLDTIDMMNRFSAERKHLILLVSTFDATLFKNITINYAVTIEHSVGGESISMMKIGIALYVCLHSTDKTAIHSLCPALGKRHALVVKSFCPSHLQKPVGKEINVLFPAFPPFSMPSPLGGLGSDFLIMQLLARKIGFIPRFIFGTSINTMLYNVSWTLYLPM